VRGEGRRRLMEKYTMVVAGWPWIRDLHGMPAPYHYFSTFPDQCSRA